MPEHPSPFVWSNGGQMLAPIIWVGTAVCTNGSWSIDYSGAGFDSAPYVTATAILNSANVYDRAFVSLSGTPSATGVSGYAVRGANLLVLGPTVRAVPDGTVIQVMAIGESFA